MARLAIIYSLLAVLQIHLLPGSGRKIMIVNNCSYTVWPASWSSSINFSLQKGESQLIDLPGKKLERIWGRTLCYNSNNNLVCKTGNCDSDNISCSYSPLDATVIEFTLDSSDETDYYDISLVIGYNLPVMVAPQDPRCKATGWIFDVDGVCPKELKRGGACLNPCTVYQNDQYCCPGLPDICKPTNYSRIFKKACPRAYSYPYDDEATSLFTCHGSPNYTITFCPSPGVFLKETSSQLPINLASRRRKSLRTTLLVALPIAIFIMLFFGTWVFIRKRTATKRYNAEIDEIRCVESLQFDWNTIRTATHNFSAENKLGEGGFGEVYKGKLRSGQEVAIKRLSKTSGQGVVEFRTEVVLVAKLQHKNLVKLLGFCLASEEKIIVYEYLPNSSLDRYLFDPTKKAALDWQMRLKIIFGIARGLLYLHEGSRLKVIHRDLKTSNILLDEDMNPKISDFGLAKLFGVDQTQGDTNRIVGTYGYMAPEYAITGHYSVKSDVFSFGVIMLEIVSGQKNRFFGGVQLEEALLHRAWRLWNEEKPLDLVDRALSNNFVEEEVMKCIHIGLLCIQEDTIQRPRMTSIVASFSGQSINLPMPKPPHFFGSANANIEEHHILHEHASPHVYTGSNTITDLYPRE